jgi:hypothetical protein
LVDLPHGQISREIFVDEGIYEEELERLFARAWRCRRPGSRPS